MEVVGRLIRKITGLDINIYRDSADIDKPLLICKDVPEGGIPFIYIFGYRLEYERIRH